MVLTSKIYLNESKFFRYLHLILISSTTIKNIAIGECPDYSFSLRIEFCYRSVSSGDINLKK